MKKSLLNSIVSFFLQLMYRYAIDIYTILIPIISFELMASSKSLQISVAVFFSSMFVSQIINSILESMNIDLLFLVLLNLIIFIFGNALLYQAHSMAMVIVARLFQGFSVGSFQLFRKVIVAAIFHEYAYEVKRKFISNYFATIGMLVTIFSALGMMAVGIIIRFYTWKYCILFLGGVSVATLFFLCIFGRNLYSEKINKDNLFKNVVGNFIQPFKNKDFLLLVIWFGMIGGVVASIHVISSFVYVDKFHVDKKFFVVLYIISSTGVFLGRGFNIIIRKRYLDEILIGVFLCFLAGSIILILEINHLLGTVSVAFTMTLYMFAITVITPSINSVVAVFFKNNVAVPIMITSAFVLLFSSIYNYIFALFHGSMSIALGFNMLIPSIIGLILYKRKIAYIIKGNVQ